MIYLDGFVKPSESITHLACQDAIRYGSINDTHYIIACDGCSSERDTDIGAKLLTLFAEQRIFAYSPVKNIDLWENYFSIGNYEFLVDLDQIELPINLSIKSLSSTLLYGILDNTGLLIVILGDGGFCLTRKASNAEKLSQEDCWIHNCYREYISPKDMPFYPIYNYIEDKEYKTLEHKWESLHKKYCASIPDIHWRSTYPYINEKLTTFFIPREDLQSEDIISLYTDGINSFVTSDGDDINEVSDFHIISNLTFNIPMACNTFLTKRYIKQKRSWVREGITNHDDFSIVSMLIE